DGIRDDLVTGVQTCALPISYYPPAGHTVAFVAVHEGTLRTPSPLSRGELAVFEPSERPIEFVADGATEFVLGSAAKHRHDLALRSEERRVGKECRYRGGRDD